MIGLKLVKKKYGRETYLLEDQESYIVATSEIYGAHGLPRDARSLVNELQQVLYGVGKQLIVN